MRYRATWQSPLFKVTSPFSICTFSLGVKLLCICPTLWGQHWVLPPAISSTSCFDQPALVKQNQCTGNEQTRPSSALGRTFFHMGVIDVGHPRMSWCWSSPCIASENAYIITCTDAITDKSASSVASFLFRLITRHGSPVIIQSDEGREFVNQVNKHLFELSGVQYHTSAAYHPQTNSLDEWFNRTLVNAPTKMTREKTS